MKSILSVLPFLALAVDARKCGNVDVPSSVQAAARYFEKMDKLADAREIQAAMERTLSIDTYVHVVAKDNTLAGGYLSKEAAQAQVCFDYSEICRFFIL